MAPIIKPESTKSIKLTYDMKDFVRKANLLIENLQKKTKEILINVAPDFSAGAAKYTPPEIGRSSIDKKYYTRPIFNLIKLLRGEYHGYFGTKEDAEQLRKYKMRYKVLYTKVGAKKGEAFAYTKTISQAKKAAKIANRGLSRVMWGKNLTNIRSKVPNSLLRLIIKSPNLNKLDLNKVKLYTNDDKTTVEIVNEVAQIERYAFISEKWGYRFAANSLARQLKKVAQENHEL